MTEENKKSLIKFGKVLLFFILAMSLIITGAGIGNYIALSKEFFYLIPMLISISIGAYTLIKNKNFFFK